MTFNGFYVDSTAHRVRLVAGGCRVRAPGVDPGLPTIGTGEYEWRGFLPAAAHPQAIDPASGQIVNWNNKPAAGFAAADDNWAYGSVHRVELLEARHRQGEASTRPRRVVAAMNKAATQDLRAVDGRAAR